MSSLHSMTIAQIAAGLRQRTFSSVEVTQAFLGRIRTLDEKLNSFITVTAESAMEQAKAADARIAAGNVAPLTGVPFAHKDIFCTKGVRTSCGSHMLDNFIAPYDATVTSRFNDAGMVMLGKTNMDRVRRWAHPTKPATTVPYTIRGRLIAYPVDPPAAAPPQSARARAVCHRHRHRRLDSATRRALRYYRHKANHGAVSRYGMIAFASSLIRRTDDEDGRRRGTGFEYHGGIRSTRLDFHRTSNEDYTRLLSASLKGLRVGSPKEFFGSDGLNSEVGAARMRPLVNLKNKARPWSR
ncbi:MAG: amidase family protein [Gammaproteobacteria bacterium]